MKRLMMLAPVLALAVSGANCAGDSSSSLSPTGPSSSLTASATEARTGGGGKKPGGGGGTTGGGSTGGGSLSIEMLSDANGDGPSWGDRITFKLTTSADKPFVSVNCYQGSAWVYSASVGYFAAYPWAKEFTLSATSWPSGAADCTARLYTSVDGSSSTTLATMNFHAGA